MYKKTEVAVVKISHVKDYKKEKDLHHSHSELEINIFLSGGGIYWVNGTEYPVLAGDVFMLFGNMFHALFIKEQQNIDLIKIIFSLDDISLSGTDHVYEELLKAFYSDSEKINVRIPANSKYSQAITRTAAQMLTDRRSESVCDGEKYLLLYILNTIKNYHLFESRNTNESFNVNVYNRVRNAMDYFDEHYMSNISIDEVAKTEYFSTNRFIDAFKKYTGFTPKKYLIMKRITKASSLLNKNEMSITEIAYHVGFNSTAAFNKAFLGVMGMTPTQYKKQTAVLQ